MSDTTFDKDQFVRTAVAFKELLDLEDLLAAQSTRALSVIGQVAVKLVALCREVASETGPVLTVKISDSVVQLAGGGRNVSFAAAHGSASDHRLLEPRAEACGQILVFSHLSGQPDSTLTTTFRVYKNGDCTDGKINWSIETGLEGCLPYLAHIVSATIFQSTVYWPGLEQMPSFLRKVPVLEEELHEDSLKKPCVGFECDLKR